MDKLIKEIAEKINDKKTYSNFIHKNEIDMVIEFGGYERVSKYVDMLRNDRIDRSKIPYNELIPLFVGEAEVTSFYTRNTAKEKYVVSLNMDKILHGETWDFNLRYNDFFVVRTENDLAFHESWNATMKEAILTDIVENYDTIVNEFQQAMREVFPNQYIGISDSYVVDHINGDANGMAM